MLGKYVGSFKLRYELPGVPVIKLGEAVRWGSEVVEITSKIYSLLVGGRCINA
jgi:hypothetical protein